MQSCIDLADEYQCKLVLYVWKTCRRKVKYRWIDSTTTSFRVQRHGANKNEKTLDTGDSNILSLRKTLVYRKTKKAAKMNLPSNKEIREEWNFRRMSGEMKFVGSERQRIGYSIARLLDGTYILFVWNGKQRRLYRSSFSTIYPLYFRSRTFPSYFVFRNTVTK